MEVEFILFIATIPLIYGGWQLATDRRQDPKRGDQWWMATLLGVLVAGVPLGIAGIGSALGALVHGHWTRAAASNVRLLLYSAVLLAVAFAIGYGVGRVNRRK
jgi:hypothetical protein